MVHMNTRTDTFHEQVYSLGSSDLTYLDGDRVVFNEGDAERTGQITLDVGGESLTITFDAFHLREFRLAVQRLEKWVAVKEETR